MKLVFSFLICLLFLNFSQAQELNLGGHVGMEVNNSTLNLGLSLEYRPNNAFVSLNTDPSVQFYKDKPDLTFPIYLKAIFGNQFRVCPFGGGFVRTSGTFGWDSGISVEYVLNNNILFIKGDYMSDYNREEAASPGGAHYDYYSISSSFWMNIGIKHRLR